MHCLCPICMGSFDNAARIVCPPCGHSFHQCCLNRWLSENRVCPTCRLAVRPADVHGVYLTFTHSHAAHDTRAPWDDPFATGAEILELRREVSALRRSRRRLVTRVQQFEDELTEMEIQYREAAELPLTPHIIVRLPEDLHFWTIFVISFLLTGCIFFFGYSYLYRTRWYLL